MRIVSWLFAGLLFLAGLPFLIYILSITFQPPSAQFYRLDSSDIELISTATQFINNFRGDNSRLPTYLEFSAWVATKDDEIFRYEGRGYTYDAGLFNAELINRVGAPPEGSFTLSFWNGSSFVTYPSWFGDGKLAYIPDSDYYLCGGKFTDVAVFSAVWFILFSPAAALVLQSHA